MKTSTTWREAGTGLWSRAAWAGTFLCGWRRAWPRSLGARSTVVSAAERIRTLAAAMTETTRQTEPDFVQLGSDLKELYRCAAELGRATNGHVQSLRDSLQNSRLTGPDGLAARSLDDLQAWIMDATRSLESLASGAANLGKLQGQGRQMERIAMFLKASSCNFAVESARSESTQQAFGAFVQELRKLAEKINDLGQVIHDQSAATSADLGRFNASITTGLDELRQLARISDSTVRQTSGQMQQLVDSAWAALQKTDSHVQVINRHANDAVFHLQFGDILRQKLEHVVTALQEAASQWHDPRARVEAAQVLVIQAGQLEVMEGEIEATRTRLAAAFAGLAEETARVLANVRTMESSGSSHSGHNSFELLKSDLTRLNELQTRGGQLCHQSDSTSSRAIEASAQLTRHLDQVREINCEMHLQALNAIVKTALLGDEGQTLGVLSMHVHSVFQESTVLVEQTVGVLREVTAHAGIGAARTRNVAGPGGPNLQAGLEQLSRVHEGFRQAIESALSLTSQQEVRLTEARRRLDFLAALSRQLAAYRVQITDFLRDVPEASSPAKAASAALGSRYTMESEREVHRRLSGQPGTQARPPGDPATLVVAAAVGASPMAAFESFESFESPPSPAATAVEIPTGSPGDGRPDLGAAPRTTASNESENLGDNIELF